MKAVPLTAYPRTALRRHGVKKLRAAARVPAVIYGRKRTPQNLEVKLKELEDLMHESVAENVLLDLAVEGDAEPKRLALLQQVQHHPLSGGILHADFHEVAADERVVITVPVETTGEALGVKTGGGVLEHVLFKLKVRALPQDLPEVLVLDVSPLDIGHAIHIGDIQPPPGVEILGSKNITVIAVSAPVTEAEEAAAAEAAQAGPLEPEVLKEKKEEGAEGAEAAPEKGAEKKGAEKPSEKAAEKPAEKKPEKKK
jgi:large subunit ribosomal protein L25